MARSAATRCSSACRSLWRSSCVRSCSCRSSRATCSSRSCSRWRMRSSCCLATASPALPAPGRTTTAARGGACSCACAPLSCAACTCPRAQASCGGEGGSCSSAAARAPSSLCSTRVLTLSSLASGAGALLPPPLCTGEEQRGPHALRVLLLLLLRLSGRCALPACAERGRVRRFGGSDSQLPREPALCSSTRVNLLPIMPEASIRSASAELFLTTAWWLLKLRLILAAEACWEGGQPQPLPSHGARVVGCWWAPLYGMCCLQLQQQLPLVASLLEGQGALPSHAGPTSGHMCEHALFKGENREAEKRKLCTKSTRPVRASPKSVLRQ